MLRSSDCPACQVAPDALGVSIQAGAAGRPWRGFPSKPGNGFGLVRQGREPFMWPDRRLIERLDIVHPIIQAPMGGASTPELVAAVSNAGGLGWLGAAMLSPDALRTAIRDIRRLTKRPFGINLFTYAI